MDKFKAYLEFVKKSLENLQTFDNIHIVLGNESCDIDSSVSTIVLAYLLYLSKTCPIPKNALIIPVQNVSKENFIYRSDNCYLYKEINLPLDLLVYRDQIDFDELVTERKVTTTLVDHHILSENNKILQNTVIQIFDHRPRDAAFPWDENKVQIVMQEVGSCITLIADKIFSTADHIMFRELGFLIYATIVYDTQALSPASGRAKELDHKITDALEDKFKFVDDKKTLFDKLWKAHNDVSQLTPKQILMKDLKIVGEIPVPGLPMLVEDFLKIEGSYNAVKSFAEDFNVPVVVLIGLDASNGVRRDVAIFSEANGSKFRDTLLEMLFNSQKYKGYDFGFSEVQTSYENIKCLKQHNVKWSRKQIIPIIKDAVDVI